MVCQLLPDRHQAASFATSEAGLDRATADAGQVASSFKLTSLLHEDGGCLPHDIASQSMAMNEHGVFLPA